MTTATTVPETAITKLQADSHALWTQAAAIIITDNETLTEAATFLRAAKALLGEIAATFDGPIKAAHETHKAMLAAKAKHAKPVEDAEKVVKRKIADYQNEQERIRRAEEARLQEIARKAEEDRRLAEAVALEAAGKAEEAAEVIEAPIVVPTVVVPKSVVKTEGVSIRKKWSFRIVNPDRVPRQFCSPDEKKIRATVTAMGCALAIEGVEIYQEDIVSASGL